MSTIDLALKNIRALLSEEPDSPCTPKTMHARDFRRLMYRIRIELINLVDQEDDGK